MINKKIIQPLISTLNDNAPLIEAKGYKYPYKAILIISIIKCVDDVNLIFNNPIKITADSPITKMYYDLLTNSETIFKALSNSKGKGNWFLSFNHEVRLSVVQNIFDMPASKIKAEGTWESNKKDRTITIHINGDEQTLEDYKTVLYNEAIKNLKKCVPDYSNLSCNEIIDYKEYLKQQLLSGMNINDDEIVKRKYQHIFRKEICERDQKCMLCNITVPSVLEAAHIKPYKVCANDIERYDEDNGILLCSNHHKMFDRCLITFDKNWEVIYSRSLEHEHKLEIVKTLSEDYKLNFKKMKTANQYLTFHNEKIFHH